MYTRLQTPLKIKDGAYAAIDTWLDARQQLIVSYCKLAALPPFDQKNQATAMPEPQSIQHFCQLLMDYLSVGHFEVYEQIAGQCSNLQAQLQASAQSLSPKIASSTDMALEFNDKYAESTTEQDPVDFDTDLSKLGQALEERFSLEDDLIQFLQEVPTSENA